MSRKLRPQRPPTAAWTLFVTPSTAGQVSGHPEQQRAYQHDGRHHLVSERRQQRAAVRERSQSQRHHRKPPLPASGGHDVCHGGPPHLCGHLSHSSLLKCGSKYFRCTTPLFRPDAHHFCGHGLRCVFNKSGPVSLDLRYHSRVLILGMQKL